MYFFSCGNLQWNQLDGGQGTPKKQKESSNKQKAPEKKATPVKIETLTEEGQIRKWLGAVPTEISTPKEESGLPSEPVWIESELSASDTCDVDQMIG